MTLPITVYRSNRLVAVTRYFQLTGVLGVVMLGGALAAGALGNEVVRAALSRNPWGPAIGAIHCVSSFLVGEAIWRHKRNGAVMALIAFAAPLAARAVGQPVSTTSLAVSAIGLIAVISIWRELSSRHQDDS
jgi:hypothetical protein